MNVYVFGLGHVGLPMACFAALSDMHVIGIDINKKVVDSILNGKAEIYEYYNNIHISTLAKQLIVENKLEINTSFERKDDSPSIFIVSVGIVSNEDFSQDPSPIINVTDTILKQIKPNDLIIFRTTLIPGTIENLIVPKLKCENIPVYLAYCPETIAETNAFFELSSNPVIIAGIDDNSFLKAKAFFRSMSDIEVIKASNIKTAEMIKVAQNISRDVNIALINELSDAALALNIDIYEVIKLANTHPRVNLLNPGPGVGGYCLPNALIYLRQSLEKQGDTTLSLMSIARECNIKRPNKIVEYMEKILNKHEKDIALSTISIIGLAMKDYCSDCRYSPALDIAKQLIRLGATVKAYDPLVYRRFSFSSDSFEECIKDSDCMIIAALQEGFNFNYDIIKNTMSNPPIIIDTRNCISKTEGIEVYKV